MLLKKLVLNPGVNTESTQTLNSSSWFASNLIRWFNGYLQKVGGWLRLSSTPLSGFSRGMHAYQDQSGDDYLFTGSNQSVQIFSAGTIYTLQLFGDVHTLNDGWLRTNALLPFTRYTIVDNDAAVTTNDLIHIDVPASVDGITLFNGVYTVASGSGSGPYAITTTVTASNPSVQGGDPPYFIIAGVSEIDGIVNPVLVNLPAHGLSVGDTFVVQVATTVGLNSLFGEYLVKSAPSPDAFYISASSPTPIFGAAYELQDAEGNPQGQVSYLTTIPADTVNWSFDNFGQVALMCYQGGPLLSWAPPISDLAAVGVLGGPQAIGCMFVAMPQAQVFAAGADVNGIFDPLLLRWSDAGNYTGWVASATNQAGSYRLSRGSKIVGGIQAPQVSLFWTDVDLWSAAYVGSPFVYSFNIVQTGCGLLAQWARTVLYGQAYWMSQKQFFTYGSGGVSVLSCSVWDQVFDDLDESNTDKCWAWSSAGFNEVWFFFPSVSGGSGEPDKYAKYSVTTQLWDYGYLSRTAGIDQSVMGSPIAADENLLLQQHEVGYDADNEPMEGVFAESGFLDLGEGSDIIFIDQLIPDFKWFGENGFLIVRITAKNYPADPGISFGPFTVNAHTRFISLRTRARQIAFRIEWASASGFSARLGALRYRPRPAGKRP